MAQTLGTALPVVPLLDGLHRTVFWPLAEGADSGLTAEQLALPARLAAYRRRWWALYHAQEVKKSLSDGDHSVKHSCEAMSDAPAFAPHVSDASLAAEGRAILSFFNPSGHRPLACLPVLMERPLPTADVLKRTLPPPAHRTSPSDPWRIGLLHHAWVPVTVSRRLLALARQKQLATKHDVIVVEGMPHVRVRVGAALLASPVPSADGGGAEAVFFLGYVGRGQDTLEHQLQASSIAWAIQHVLATMDPAAEEVLEWAEDDDNGGEEEEEEDEAMRSDVTPLEVIQAYNKGETLSPRPLTPALLSRLPLVREPRTVVECVRALQLLVPQVVNEWLGLAFPSYGYRHLRPRLQAMSIVAAALLTPGLHQLTPTMPGFRKLPEDSKSEGCGDMFARVGCHTRPITAPASLLRYPQDAHGNAGRLTSAHNGVTGDNHAIGCLWCAHSDPADSSASTSSSITAAGGGVIMLSSVLYNAGEPVTEERQLHDDFIPGVASFLHKFAQYKPDLEDPLPCICGALYYLYALLVLPEINRREMEGKVAAAIAPRRLEEVKSDSDLAARVGSLRQQQWDATITSRPGLGGLTEAQIAKLFNVYKRWKGDNFTHRTVDAFASGCLQPILNVRNVLLDHLVHKARITARPGVHGQGDLPPQLWEGNPTKRASWCDFTRSAAVPGSAPMVFLRLWTRLCCQVENCGRTLLGLWDPAEHLLPLAGELPLFRIAHSLPDAGLVAEAALASGEGPYPHGTAFTAGTHGGSSIGGGGGGASGVTPFPHPVHLEGYPQYYRSDFSSSRSDVNGGGGTSPSGAKSSQNAQLIAASPTGGGSGTPAVTPTKSTKTGAADQSIDDLLAEIEGPGRSSTGKGSGKKGKGKGKGKEGGSEVATSPTSASSSAAAAAADITAASADGDDNAAAVSSRWGALEEAEGEAQYYGYAEEAAAYDDGGEGDYGGIAYAQEDEEAYHGQQQQSWHQQQPQQSEKDDEAWLAQCAAGYSIAAEPPDDWQQPSGTAYPAAAAEPTTAAGAADAPAVELSREAESDDDGDEGAAASAAAASGSPDADDGGDDDVTTLHNRLQSLRATLATRSALLTSLPDKLAQKQAALEAELAEVSAGVSRDTAAAEAELAAQRKAIEQLQQRLATAQESVDLIQAQIASLNDQRAAAAAAAAASQAAAPLSDDELIAAAAAVDPSIAAQAKELAALLAANEAAAQRHASDVAAAQRAASENLAALQAEAAARAAEEEAVRREIDAQIAAVTQQANAYAAQLHERVQATIAQKDAEIAQADAQIRELRQQLEAASGADPAAAAAAVEEERQALHRTLAAQSQRLMELDRLAQQARQQQHM